MEVQFHLIGFELRKFDEFRNKVRSELRSGLDGPINKSFKRWAEIYLKFLFTRYNIYSMGGGDWPPKKRRKGKRVGSNAILIETYALRDALSPYYRGPAQSRIRTPNGIRVGYGPAKHPNSKLSYANLAALHQNGFINRYGSHVPARPIVVGPSAEVSRECRDVLMSNLAAYLRSK